MTIKVESISTLQELRALYSGVPDKVEENFIALGFLKHPKPEGTLPVLPSDLGAMAYEDIVALGVEYRHWDAYAGGVLEFLRARVDATKAEIAGIEGTLTSRIRGTETTPETRMTEAERRRILYANPAWTEASARLLKLEGTMQMVTREHRRMYYDMTLLQLCVQRRRWRGYSEDEGDGNEGILESPK